MTTGVACPLIIPQFFDNSGNPCVGGTVLTQVGGVNQSVYQDSGLTTALPNPFPLNSRGEASTAAGASTQVFLTPNTVYTFTLSDANGNQLWVATYVNGVQVNQAQIGALLWPQTTAEKNAGVTPTYYYYAPGDVRRYGADPTGTNDSSGAFSQAFLVEGLISAVGAFLINSGLTMDMSTTSLVGPCSITSGLAASAGALLTIIASGGPEANSKNLISGVEFIGQQHTGVQALVFNTASNADDIFGVENCTFSQFADGVWIKNNAWEIEFHRCAFSSCGADHAALWSNYAGSERVSAVQCEFYNCTECVRCDEGGEVFLNNCSLDYSNRVFNCTLGSIFATTCYIENNLDTDYWLKAGSGDALISMDHCLIAQTGPKTLFNIGQSLGAGIYIRNTKFYTNTNTVVYPIIAGAGGAFASGCIIDGFSQNGYAWPQFSLASELCANGGFGNGTGGTGGWTLTNSGAGGTSTQSGQFQGTASATGNQMTVSAVTSGTLHVGDIITGTNVPIGTTILAIPAGGGTGVYTISSSTGFASTTINCYALAVTTTSAGFLQYANWTVSNVTPGDNVGASCVLQSNNSAASFYLTVTAYGADGTALGTNTLLSGYNGFNGGTYPAPTTWQYASAVIPSLPPGTTTVKVQLQGDQTTTHTTLVKNVHVGKY